MANAFVDKLNRFARLDVAEVAALEEATAHPRAFAARQDLIREGDQPGPVFVVLEGWVFRYKILPRGTRQIMAFLVQATAATCTTTCSPKWITASRPSRRRRSP
jgi:CRP-like cAMP-binding protein